MPAAIWLRGRRSFGLLIACSLNFLQAQAQVALDPRAAPENRAYAAAEILDTLDRLPGPGPMAEMVAAGRRVSRSAGR